MMFSNKFVLSVKVGNSHIKNLANGEVHIPFGSEFVVHLQNKHDRWCKVDLLIDGESVTPEGLAIAPHGQVDLCRPTTHDRAFKFAALDSIDAHLAGKDGDNTDKVKGTVVAKFYLEVEKPKPATVIHEHHYYQQWPTYYHYGNLGGNWHSVSGNVLLGAIANSVSRSAPLGVTCSSLQGATVDWASIAPSSFAPESQLQDGCTVEGNATGQTFGSISKEFETTCTTLNMFLRGYNSGAPVTTTTSDFCAAFGIPIKPMKSMKTMATELSAENEILRKQILKVKNDRIAKEQKENERLKAELAELLNT